MIKNSTSGWQFWIDRGGTFTDVVAVDPRGGVHTAKLLSENPGRYKDAAIAGIRRILGLSGAAPLSADQIGAVKMGTTVATNALLERKGDPVLLVINRGLADLLHIGDQKRPALFALNVDRPQPLYERVAEVDARVSAEGDVLCPLQEDSARRVLRTAYDDGIRSVALVLMHSYRFPDDERRLGEIARDIGFTHITLSHAASPLMKIVPRGQTAVADAYLTPTLHRYVDQVSTELHGIPLYFMQSNGGLTHAAAFTGKDAILSGPAGGVVGAVKAAAAAGFDHLIGFDMGGTSTDVCHYAGAYERRSDSDIAGVKVRTPALHVHTVAAGGGSILSFDGSRFRVGPESAGAYPGPAAYRNGGPLTITDCNVMLGRIDPDHFPAVFGPSGDAPLDRPIVAQKFAALAAEIGGMSAEETAEGFLNVAVENMARAIKKISVERGYDIANHCLVAFGGAAGQHACRVADRLNMAHVLLHPLAGVLSAYGIGLADVRVIKEAAVEADLSPANAADLEKHVTDLSADTRAALAVQGIDSRQIRLDVTARLRVKGTDTPLPVPFGSVETMAQTFHHIHRQHFGFLEDGKPIIVESVAVEGISGSGSSLVLPPLPTANPIAKPAKLYISGAWREVNAYDRITLPAGFSVPGPALIFEDHGSIVVEPGWQADMLANGSLRLARVSATHAAITADLDPVALEIFNSLFMSVAEEMGAVLENTAHSVNMKERLDFSCAIFDHAGRLIANAPHMPVHLGSMGLSVRTVMAQHGDAMRPGDCYVLNDPYNGGTHLPDVTVVSPVFVDGGTQPAFFVASRGHHADIGGISPGSMPPFSRTVADEGALLDGFLLVRDGVFFESDVRTALKGNACPARNPDQNIADLKAQAAANTRGGNELTRLCETYSAEVVSAYMGHVRAYAADAVRRVIDALTDGAAEVALDNGAFIRVRVSVDKTARRATIDFTGTSPQTQDNFNAPAAVATAAVLYVFRCLVDDDIPLNDGCLEPLDIILPAGSLLNPRPSAAVVAGNVETSQAVVNALLLATAAAAAAQGTMNNLTFGDEQRQYYETIGGGMGAGKTFDGASGIQCHMTNSRLTDPEVLEWRFPVILKRFAIREGSGGDGRHTGGNGLVREILFCEPMSAAILANNRIAAPAGLHGGDNGAPGRNAVRRADGTMEDLPFSCEVAVHPGDALMVETPGGGGYGAK